MKMRAVTMFAALASVAITPVAVMADPPAASVPLMPGPFIGAPTNDNPSDGQFTVNFDDQGRYLGTGTAPEHYASFDLAPVRGVPQAGSRNVRSEAAAQVVFAAFAQRLREIAALEARADRTTSRR
jgi:hypothetical protein